MPKSGGSNAATASTISWSAVEIVTPLRRHPSPRITPNRYGSIGTRFAVMRIDPEAGIRKRRGGSGAAPDMTNIAPAVTTSHVSYLGFGSTFPWLWRVGKRAAGCSTRHVCSVPHSTCTPLSKVNRSIRMGRLRKMPRTVHAVPSPPITRSPICSRSIGVKPFGVQTSVPFFRPALDSATSAVYTQVN